MTQKSICQHRSRVSRVGQSNESANANSNANANASSIATATATATARKESLACCAGSARSESRNRRLKWPFLRATQKSARLSWPPAGGQVAPTFGENEICGPTRGATGRDWPRRAATMAAAIGVRRNSFGRRATATITSRRCKCTRAAEKLSIAQIDRVAPLRAVSASGRGRDRAAPLCAAIGATRPASWNLAGAP